MRLDKYLAEHGFESRTKAARAIAEGRVFINGKVAKASDEVDSSDAVIIRDTTVPFVSEGGAKLQKALDEFAVDVRGKVFADIGASTGGFTDCLLRAGAARVYAVDVGKSQLHPSLAADRRVIAMDGKNARYLCRADFPETIDGAVVDVSFISLKLVLPAVASVLGEGGVLFALIKPQFECGGRGLDKHGILKDENRREEVVREVCAFAVAQGLYLQGLTEAPRRVRKNVEYVALFSGCAEGAVSAEERIVALRRRG